VAYRSARGRARSGALFVAEKLFLAGTGFQPVQLLKMKSQHDRQDACPTIIAEAGIEHFRFEPVNIS
jgi:hypothetical protein